MEEAEPKGQIRLCRKQGWVTEPAWICRGDALDAWRGRQCFLHPSLKNRVNVSITHMPNSLLFIHRILPGFRVSGKSVESCVLPVIQCLLFPTSFTWEGSFSSTLWGVYCPCWGRPRRLKELMKAQMTQHLQFCLWGAASPSNPAASYKVGLQGGGQKQVVTFPSSIGFWLSASSSSGHLVPKMRVERTAKMLPSNLLPSRLFLG